MAKLAGLAVILSANIVLAAGFQLDRYEPTAAGEMMFSVEAPWYSATRWFAGGFTLDYAHAPLTAGTYDGFGYYHKDTNVIEHMPVGHFDLAGSFLDRVLVGFSLPVTMAETGNPAYGVAPIGGAAVGDPRLSAMVRVWRHMDDPVSVHAGGMLWIPIGAEGDHAGDSNVRGLLRVVLGGLGVKHLRWATELGFLIRETANFGASSSLPGTLGGSEIQLGVALAYCDVDKRFQVGPEITFATTLDNHAFSQESSHIEILAGAGYNIVKQVQLGLAVGTGLIRSVGTPDARLLFRLAYAPIK